MLSFIILIALMALPWFRLIRPGGGAAAGRVVHVHSVPLLARMRMHLVPASVVLLGAVALVWFGDLPWWGLLVAAASIAALFLTTEAVIADKPEPAPAMPAGADGGMGGMDF